jgi:hypothetical protein
MQRIEHYEISAYGTMVMTAEALELQPVVKVLQQTLAEEQQTEAKLAQMAKNDLMTSALDDEGEEEEEPAQASAPKTGSSKRAPARRSPDRPAAGKSAGAKPAPEKPATPRPSAKTGSSRPAARRGR